MNGIKLEAEELAYLLATVDAPGLIGVDDPKLVPSTAKSRDTTFSKGRKQLEAHGWVQEISGKPGEYDLNAGLFHTVAVMAAPEMVVATDVCLCEYTDHGHCGILNSGSPTSYHPQRGRTLN